MAHLGSIHAFSVLIAPIEARFGASRAEASVTYSLALVTLTAMVLLGPYLYGERRGAAVMLVSGAGAAAGAGIAALSSSLPGLWIGYSLIFGAANGLGYGFGLQIAAAANPGREGLAMGLVTAAYALGATVAPSLFQAAVADGGMPAAMTALGVTAAVAGAGAALLVHLSGARLPTPAHDGKMAGTAPVVALWLAYGSAVFAGLMAIGHAAEIVRQGDAHLLWLAPSLIAVFNMAGSIAAGMLADRTPARILLTGLPLLSAIALLAAATGQGGLLLPALGVIGFCYGAIISLYPVAIAKIAGMAAGPRLYGRVFTAWGSAGLVAPWMAGLIFDLSGGYAAALGLAALLSAVSAGIAARLPIR